MIHPLQPFGIRSAFDHVGGSLRSRNGQPLNWFEVINADEGGFVKASAEMRPQPR